MSAGRVGDLFREGVHLPRSFISFVDISNSFMTFYSIYWSNGPDL